MSGEEKMRVRYIAIGAAAVLLLGTAVTALSFEGMPTEHLRQEGALVTPVVEKTTTPAGPYMMVAGVAALVGSGTCMARSLKRRAGGRGGG